MMRQALELAAESAVDGEIPIGCVIADSGGRIVGRGRNRRERNRNALAHAEIEAIDSACATLGAWRLEGCTAYVTLEPCPMCAGAFRAARIARVCFGASNTNPNAVGPAPTFEGGLLENECKSALSEFFRTLR
ncbi:MAG: nucleoside deaminase [Oscillospiraceae bacterium]|jgi:tRNA(adenine34) deaminase|nr:nucleoside deaminase [Oscillospiraceae bacterium]